MTRFVAPVRIFVMLGCIALISPACERRAGAARLWGPSTPQPNVALRSLVEGKNGMDAVVARSHMSSSERTQLVDQVQRFYQRQNYQLIWVKGERPSNRYRQLARVLDAADEHGLPAELYELPIGRTAETKIADEEAPQLDVKATASLFRFLMHLTGGRIDPHTLHPLWTLKPEKPDLVAALSEAVNSNTLEATTARLQPLQPEYRELQQALVRYRAIAGKGGWPMLPERPRPKPGQQSPMISALRQRLSSEGDLPAVDEKGASPVYDADVIAALRRFEERHRIKPDGILDSETVKALNVPVQQRIRTIELNLERWRWMPDKMPDRYIIVNVPDFRLEVVEHQKTVISMRVVVGAPDNKTPIFSDEMTHVIFSPYWNVPPGIAREETLPRAASDPGFLARNNMEVVGPSGKVVNPELIDWSTAGGLRIRQRPGTGNALGGVKFMFPNNFDVYLHDTNATRLFERIERGLSHGCVRVEEPDKLAQYVLRDQPEWTAEAIAFAMTSGRETHVKLKSALPVYITYTTASVHEGGVRFLKDLYGHDAAQSARLWPAERP